MKYQVIILDAIGGQTSVLRATIEQRITELGLNPAEVLQFFDEDEIDNIDLSSPGVGVLMSNGAKGRNLSDQVEKLQRFSTVVVPAVSDLQKYSEQVPDALFPVNGFQLDSADPRYNALAALCLELLGLLRRRRRLFLSYKRSESKAVASQLHDALLARSFDVFLDTLSIRSADLFQQQLWHRMTDSDVVVLLYTKSVHQSGWVEQEIERATAMKITVLQVIWPGVPRDPRTELFEPYYLEENKDITDKENPQLTEACVDRICTRVESLRARALAARQADLVGSLRELAELKGVESVIQRTRYVDLRKNEKVVRVIPTIGVPDSESFHDGSRHRHPDAQECPIVLLFDAWSITPNWLEHLGWLDGFLPVKVLKTAEMMNWIQSTFK
jgi:TIR domain